MSVFALVIKESCEFSYDHNFIIHCSRNEKSLISFKERLNQVRDIFKVIEITCPIIKENKLIYMRCQDSDINYSYAHSILEDYEIKGYLNTKSENKYVEDTMHISDSPTRKEIKEICFTHLDFINYLQDFAKYKKINIAIKNGNIFLKPEKYKELIEELGVCVNQIRIKNEKNMNIH